MRIPSKGIDEDHRKIYSEKIIQRDRPEIQTLNHLVQSLASGPLVVAH